MLCPPLSFRIRVDHEVGPDSNRPTKKQRPSKARCDGTRLRRLAPSGARLSRHTRTSNRPSNPSSAPVLVAAALRGREALRRGQFARPLYVPQIGEAGFGNIYNMGPKASHSHPTHAGRAWQPVKAGGGRNSSSLVGGAIPTAGCYCAHLAMSQKQAVDEHVTGCCQGSRSRRPRGHLVLDIGLVAPQLRVCLSNSRTPHQSDPSTELFTSRDPHLAVSGVRARSLSSTLRTEYNFSTDALSSLLQASWHF